MKMTEKRFNYLYKPKVLTKVKDLDLIRQLRYSEFLAREKKEPKEMKSFYIFNN